MKRILSLKLKYEEAAIKATTKVFDVGIECCLFHLCQAHWRKIQDLGLRQTYIEDSSFFMSCKMMSALAFVPVSDVYSVFSEFLRVVQSYCDRENFRRKFFRQFF